MSNEISNVEVPVLGSENIFADAVAPWSKGVSTHVSNSGVTQKFKRGEMLFEPTNKAQTLYNGLISNTYNTNTYNKFIGICVNDVTIAPNEDKTFDVYTAGNFIWKRIYELQTPSVKALIPQPGKYYETINLAIAH